MSSKETTFRTNIRDRFLEHKNWSATIHPPPERFSEKRRLPAALNSSSHSLAHCEHRLRLQTIWRQSDARKHAHLVLLLVGIDNSIDQSIFKTEIDVCSCWRIIREFHFTLFVAGNRLIRTRETGHILHILHHHHHQHHHLHHHHHQHHHHHHHHRHHHHHHHHHRHHHHHHHHHLFQGSRMRWTGNC